MSGEAGVSLVKRRGTGRLFRRDEKFLPVGVFFGKSAFFLGSGSISSDVSQVRDFRNHARDWRGFFYVYPVLSRRSGGLSIGVNLNPDTACNFDCIYCQVDRKSTPRVRHVDLKTLEVELEAMLAAAMDGSLFETPEFRETTPALRRVNDIAFSGDGEPTTCPVFKEAVTLAADLRSRHEAGSGTAADSVKLVLITDACYLTRGNVVEALEILDRSNGEIWAKLDAGTEAYYRLVNRPNFPLGHVVENVIHAARRRAVVIQSLFMRVHGEGPAEGEIAAYTDRLVEILEAGGRISGVQVYTVARVPAESYVSALSDDEVEAIAGVVRKKTGLPATVYFG
jgi:wyosine [tRNA(Phe)-imidazoG37] synthetase (radical SAM superfamily)